MKVSRLRCFSMSRFMAGGQPSTGGPYSYAITKLSTISKASSALVFIDEDDSTLDDGGFLYHSGAPNDPLRWDNRPGYRHSRGTVGAFADGHAEYHKWMSSITDTGAAGTSSHNDLISLAATAPSSPYQ